MRKKVERIFKSKYFSYKVLERRGLGGGKASFKKFSSPSYNINY